MRHFRMIQMSRLAVFKMFTASSFPISPKRKTRVWPHASHCFSEVSKELLLKRQIAEPLRAVQHRLPFRRKQPASMWFFSGKKKKKKEDLDIMAAVPNLTNHFKAISLSFYRVKYTAPRLLSEITAWNTMAYGMQNVILLRVYIIIEFSPCFCRKTYPDFRKYPYFSKRIFLCIHFSIHNFGWLCVNNH